MEQLKEKIHSLTAAYKDEIIGYRRHLHMHPELSMKEFNTSKYIAAKLDEFGIPYEDGIAVTGILAKLEGKNPGKAMIALRADMDALPIIEKNSHGFQSKNPGVMHACGHDAHMASLLGAVKILSTLKDEFEGTIKIIFQPSEESYPGGALLMIQDGIFDKEKPQSIFGQHVLPGMDAGRVGMRGGKYMASTDEIFLTVNGKGGHAATPDLVIDPILIASHIVVALQQLVSRHVSPILPTVLSFGKFTASGKTNVIPDEARLEGIIRTFDEDWRAEIKRRIRKMASGIAESMGGSCDVTIDKGYPALENDIELTNRAMQWAEEFLGPEVVEELPQRMTSEDFSYYAQLVPACFYRFGVRNEEKGITSNLHTSTFDLDESSLETGMGLMAWLAVKELDYLTSKTSP